MSPSRRTKTPEPLPKPAAATVEERLRAVGTQLGDAIGAVLGALPGAPLRPNQLVGELGVNRAVASRVLNATAKRDGLEVMHQIPGPEPLRKLVRAAVGSGVSDELAQTALDAIHAFDLVISSEAGTRAALDALISASLPGARERFELASKYSVFKGLSQLKGVQAELWVSAAVVAPSAEDPERHDLTWLNGAVAMQRLRPGVTVRFSYRYRAAKRDRDKSDELPTIGVLPLDQFCVNPPAQLETHTAGETIHYTLPDDLLGPRELTDMFVVDHHPSAMNRFAKPAERKQTSLFAEPAIPVGTLVFDAIVHEDVFTGSQPQLLQYDTAYHGIANVNDEARDIDRADTTDSIEFLGRDMSRFQMAELSSYGPMLAHLGDRFGWDPTKFRGYRTRIQYPVYGWQVCLAFEPPTGRG